MPSAKRLQEIWGRKREIRKMLEDNPNMSMAELNEIGKELDGLDSEELEIRKVDETAAGIANGTVATRTVATFTPGGASTPNEKERRTMRTDFENMKPQEVRETEEYRSAFFKTMQGRELTELEQRAFSSGMDSAGAAIPTVTHGQVIEKLRQSVALFPHISVTELPGNVTIPVEDEEAGATWVDELADIPESGNPIKSVKLGGFTLAKLIPVSIAAETMSAPAFEGYLTNIIAEKMAVEIEKAILNGTGEGQPTGILTGVTWTDDENAFGYEDTGLTYDDVLKPLANLGSAYLPSAAWSMNSKTLYEQVAKVTGEDGKSIFVPDAVEGFAGRIMGKGVVIDDYMPADTILFGAFRRYFMNFSQPIIFEKSRESGFRKATVDYRAVAVVDGKPAMDEAFIKLEKAPAA